MSLVILLSVFTLTCPNNNSLPLDGKHAESRHIWSFEKKKTCASNKGDSQTKYMHLCQMPQSVVGSCSSRRIA